ncbi:MAG: CoA transferase [Chloroflexi bacterium]|nr:CoA transferase [Chloroflexota bacterium]
MSEGALEGVKVLDLTHHIAGPWCTKLLADYGAEVLKVERPEGDPARRMAPFFHDEISDEKSLLFLYLNTSKQGVTINLKSQQGLRMLRELVKDAHLLVENFSPRVMPSLGLDYSTLRELNPSLVMVSISNFGQTGPYRDYRATEIVEYALGGLMYIFGAYDREPLKHALHQAQFKAGTNAASASLMALYHQRATGEGQHVDVSIQECIASALRDVVNNYTYTGAVRRRQPNHSGDLTRLRATSDGFVLPNPGIGGGLNWQTVVEFLGVPELADEKFDSPSARLANAEDLGRILDAHFRTQKKSEVFHAAHERRFIYGLIQSPKDVLEDAQFESRGYFVDLEHPVVGTVKYPGPPFLMTDTPWQARRPAPTLGQHNQEVLGGRLGYSNEKLSRLRAQEVI